ncbi:MAG TPA: copper resistance CopC family protein [Ilumatobacter sp.]|nr:copper resistance CopC family protein [Ilumatobacter sp.]
MKRAVVALAGVVAAVCAALAGATTAHAHAELVESSPIDGAMLTGLPAVVELTFSEPVGKPADLVVLGPDGAPLSSGEVTTLDTVLWTTIDSGAAAADGWYTVSYQVTSADGHLITGTTTFMVHTDGNTAMPVTPGPGGASASTSADPMLVGALLGGLAAALIYALAAVRRLLVSGPVAAP